MTHPIIHIKASRPMPDSVKKALKEKKDRRDLYAKGDIGAIREKDSKKDVSSLPGRQSR